jgi:hypothetical protein
MNKVIRDGKVAVLYSPGFGAGWYSWNPDKLECLFSPEIVKMVENKEEITEDVCNSLFGKDFYSGGSEQLQIAWIPEGTKFRVHEYDGSESIVYLDINDFYTA